MARRTRLLLVVALACALLALAPASIATTWSVSATGTVSQAAASASPAPPPAPTSTCVSSSSNTVTVTWAAVTHATSYIVYQATASAGPYSQAATVTAPTTTWTSGALSAGTFYWKVTGSVQTNWVTAQSAVSAARTVTRSGQIYTCS